ncbi:diguanylate cyclase domain-containing protein [Cellulosilyticum sp. I15G10I2]|uniref:diguanylate cyclase domain-containing protein n=1 Tax=Cellulosilyticum sp. I15G10I2 TaxID=1892843 RepID=UPI00085C8D7D|nr:diguanylate cyclase [Cellulosilyticum sp. I15G10I2]
MDSILEDALNCINEGIVILNEDLEVLYLNNYMLFLTHKSADEMLNKNLYEVLPKLNKDFFRRSIQGVIENGCKLFFSAALHKNVINANYKLNLKISKVEKAGKSVILLEFIDVTNQIFRIKQLKDYVEQLHTLNNELKEKEKVIKKLAYYDKLTGVANRTLFYEFSEKMLDHAKRNNELLGIMFIDVNKFKYINDTHGHEVGDRVLMQVANMLKEATRKSDIVARYGGDEFLILLPNIKSYENYNRIVSRIIHTKNHIVENNGEAINISLSIGASFYPTDGDTIDTLIVKADKAMYVAKKTHGENNSFYDEHKVEAAY